MNSSLGFKIFDFKMKTALSKKSSISYRTFGSFNKIVEDMPKTPLPGVNVTTAVEIAVS